MKLNVNGVVIEATAVGYSLKEAERPTRIVLENGIELSWRTTVTAIYEYTNAQGEKDCIINHNSVYARLA